MKRSQKLKDIDYGGTSNNCRPKNRFFEEVQKDLAQKEVQNWRNKEMDFSIV